MQQTSVCRASRDSKLPPSVGGARETPPNSKIPGLTSGQGQGGAVGGRQGALRGAVGSGSPASRLSQGQQSPVCCVNSFLHKRLELSPVSHHVFIILFCTIVNVVMEKYKVKCFLFHV